jgi:hypothetical protein
MNENNLEREILIALASHRVKKFISECIADYKNIIESNINDENKTKKLVLIFLEILKEAFEKIIKEGVKTS